MFFLIGTLTANEAWMITRQLGYNNNFVLEGGLNYWFDAILNPQKPAATSPMKSLQNMTFVKAPEWHLVEGEQYRQVRIRVLHH